MEQTHLDDPVLWRPPPLPLEHRVNVGGHRHHHRLWLPPCIHVPLLCVLVDLVMVKTSEGHICGQDHLRALILQEKWTLINFPKKEINVKTNVSSPHRPLSLGTPAVRAGQTWMMGTHCSRVFTASGYTTQVYKPPHCISCPLPASDGDERYNDIDGHICIPSQRILSFSLLQMLCYLFASQSHWASPTNPHSLDDDDMDQDLDEEEDCFCCCRLLILIHTQMTLICLQVRSTWG